VRVTVLGTSSGWPIPRLGCDCAQCTSTDPRDRRLRPAVLLDRAVLVDAGPDLYHQLLRAGELPEAIVLTHAHADHVLGLYELAKLGRVPVYCSPDTEKQVRTILPRLQLRLVRVAPGERVPLPQGITAQAFDVEHGRDRMFGWRFTGPAGESLVYVPDMEEPPASKLARGCDLAFLDGSTRTATTRGHLAMEDAIPMARRLGMQRVLFTHVGHRVGLHAELDEWLPDGFATAYDGMVVDLDGGPPGDG